MINIDNRTDVLISGGGPAGLMMACQLAIHNIPFRIVDKKKFPVNYSGALIVHSRSLEIFHQMGICEKAINMGVKVQKINIRFNGRKNIIVNFDNLPKNITRYPFFLLLKQGYTEKLLRDFLYERGYVVESNTTLLTFKQNKDSVISELKKPDGSKEVISSRFLIGADGASSLVRTQLKIPFKGKTHAALLYITDCRTTIPYTENEIYFDFTKSYATGFFPLPGNKWRSDGMIPALQERRKNVSFEDIRSFFSGNIHPPVELYEKRWFSVFRSHSRCAKMFRQNHCFLIGDASHVHSPVGAQGMNTGFQDAYNLAWKLSFFIKGKANENLLDTYQKERRPLALKLIHYTDLTFNFITTEVFVLKFFRLYFSPILLRWFNKHIIWSTRFFISISGLGIKYVSLPESSTSGKFPRHAPRPGELLPYIPFSMRGQYSTLYDNLTSRTFHLFVFEKDPVPLAFKLFTEKYGKLISIKCIGYEKGTEHLFAEFGLNRGGYYLVRPDLYIAFRDSVFNTKSLERFLIQFLR